MKFNSKLIIKTTLVAVLLLVMHGVTFAQEEESETEPLVISGSVDTYYKYDFAKTDGNIGTSFAGDHNSFSLGMINLIASQSIGKVSFVGDVAFGPRNANSIPTGDNVGIQNLFVSYAFSDKFSIDAGYMGTFVGYEIISPTGNFNYSTSYLFTNGPFQNAGLKLNYAFSDAVSVMGGVFNDWNVYTDTDDELDFGAQLAITPSDDFSVYINYATSKIDDGDVIDITGGYTAGDLYIGFNAASRSDFYTGVALYPQYSFSDDSGLGLRFEYFANDEAPGSDTSATAITLTGNFKSGSLTFIPELRLDSASDDVFTDSDGAPA